MATINIQIDIPDNSPVGVAELKDLLTEYSQWLLSEGHSYRKGYNHESIAGILTDTPGEVSLKDEYIKEKFLL